MRIPAAGFAPMSTTQNPTPPPFATVYEIAGAPEAVVHRDPHYQYHHQGHLAPTATALFPKPPPVVVGFAEGTDHRLPPSKRRSTPAAFVDDLLPSSQIKRVRTDYDGRGSHFSPPRITVYAQNPSEMETAPPYHGRGVDQPVSQPYQSNPPQQQHLLNYRPASVSAFPIKKATITGTTAHVKTDMDLRYNGNEHQHPHHDVRSASYNVIVTRENTGNGQVNAKEGKTVVDDEGMHEIMLAAQVLISTRLGRESNRHPYGHLDSRSTAMMSPESITHSPPPPPYIPQQAEYKHYSKRFSELEPTQFHHNGNTPNAPFTTAFSHTPVMITPARTVDGRSPGDVAFIDSNLISRTSTDQAPGDLDGPPLSTSAASWSNTSPPPQYVSSSPSLSPSLSTASSSLSEEEETYSAAMELALFAYNGNTSNTGPVNRMSGVYRQPNPGVPRGNKNVVVGCTGPCCQGAFVERRNFNDGKVSRQQMSNRNMNASRGQSVQRTLWYPYSSTVDGSNDSDDDGSSSSGLSDDGIRLWKAVDRRSSQPLLPSSVVVTSNDEDDDDDGDYDYGGDDDNDPDYIDRSRSITAAASGGGRRSSRSYPPIGPEQRQPLSNGTSATPPKRKSGPKSGGKSSRRNSTSSVKKRSRTSSKQFELDGGSKVDGGSGSDGGGAKVEDGEGSSSVSKTGTSRKACSFCRATSTPMWRHGPPEYPDLCNRCGVKWMRGRLLPG
ncbi:hypothetical protein HK102_000028 [Quaeritorhiza haematococci]|nr:hypothetical protein HK102_000028 [Quaeritorhiza haematococci]